MADDDGAGTRYPFISLEKALGRARELYDADPRGREMAISAAFTVWKYSEKSSGGHQTVGALRMYGLITRTGMGKIALSEAALRYFRDERDDVKAKLLASFALQPKLVAALWKDWKDSPPGDAIARSHLKNDRGLTDQAARSLLAIYKENITFANLKSDAMIPPEQEEDNGDEEDVLPPPKVKLGDYVQWTSGGVDQFRAPRKIIGFLDGEHVQVFGSNTGVPVSELTVVPPPTPNQLMALPARVEAASAGIVGENEYSVLQRGNRLQITADVDLEGLAMLKEMIGDYESILRRLAGKKEK